MASVYPASRGSKGFGTTLAAAFSATPIRVDGQDGGGDPFAPIVDQRHVPALATDAVLEPLEARQLMSVSLDSAGWTVVTPASDSRVIYVSNSGGSDSNPGLSANSPVKTIARAISLVRDDSADQVLFKRGDTWTGETFGFWKKSGRSEQQPILISAYGVGDRPMIKTGTSSAITIGSISAQSVSHLVISGLHFYADGRDFNVPGFNKNTKAYAIQCIAGGTGITIEDVKAEKYMTNISFVSTYGQMHDVTVRRSVLVDAYAGNVGGLHPQGIFVDGVQGFTLEQNILDHNGWAEGVSGAEPSIYNHNAYITGGTSGVVVTGNVFANASSHGLQARSGGVVTGNLFLKNPIGMSYGLVNGGGTVTVGGVFGEVSDNVFIGGRDIDGSGRGIGIEIANVRANKNTVIQRNIWAQYEDAAMPAIMLTSGVGTKQADAVGLHDLTLRDNIVYKWARGLSVQGGMSATASGNQRLDNVVLRGNDFVDITTGKVLMNANDLDVDRRTGSEARSNFGRTFSAPDRSVASYSQSIGGSNTNWYFTSNARTLGKGEWDGRYTATAAINHIRGGFGLSALSGGGTTDPTPNPNPNPAPPPPPPPPIVVPPPPPPQPTPEPEEPPVVGETPKVRKRDAAVYVKALKFKGKHHVQKLVVKFSRDVGTTVDLNDLAISASGQAVDLSGAQFSYNAKKRTAEWVLASDDVTKLQKGMYSVSLSAAGITDGLGKQLDGDKDRVGGDDLVRMVKVKR